MPPATTGRKTTTYQPQLEGICGLLFFTLSLLFVLSNMATQLFPIFLEIVQPKSSTPFSMIYYIFQPLLGNIR